MQLRRSKKEQELPSQRPATRISVTTDDAAGASRTTNQTPVQSDPKEQSQPSSPSCKSKITAAILASHRPRGTNKLKTTKKTVVKDTSTQKQQAQEECSTTSCSSESEAVPPPHTQGAKMIDKEKSDPNHKAGSGSNKKEKKSGRRLFWSPYGDDREEDALSEDDTLDTRLVDNKTSNNLMCGFMPIKQSIADRYDAAVNDVNNVCIPRMALAMMCLTPTEQSVELGYQDEGKKRQARRKMQRRRKVKAVAAGR